MISDQSIGREFELSDEQTAEILYDDPSWALRIGLKNFQSNEPMAEFLRQKISSELSKGILTAIP